MNQTADEPKPLYALTREVPGITVPVYMARRGRDIVVGSWRGYDQTYYGATTDPARALTRRTEKGIAEIASPPWTVVNIATLTEGTS